MCERQSDRNKETKMEKENKKCEKCFRKTVKSVLSITSLDIIRFMTRNKYILLLVHVCLK